MYTLHVELHVAHVINRFYFITGHTTTITLVHSTMAHIYEITLTDREISHFKDIFTQKTHFTPFCHIWRGAVNKDGYGIYRPSLRGKQLKVTVHRFIYYIHNMDRFDKQLHISHLCHNKQCVNISHLSMEPQSVNNSRKTCVAEGQCTGHGTHGGCLFQ